MVHELGDRGHVRMGRNAQKVRRGTLVPPKDALSSERLPEAIDRVAVKQADRAPVWLLHRRLVAHAGQGLRPCSMFHEHGFAASTIGESDRPHRVRRLHEYALQELGTG